MFAIPPPKITVSILSHKELIKSNLVEIFAPPNTAKEPPLFLRVSFDNAFISSSNKKPAQALGIFFEGKLVCLYTHESDLGDGWEDKEVHDNTEQKRLEALKMGSNIIEFVFTQ